MKKKTFIWVLSFFATASLHAQINYLIVAGGGGGGAAPAGTACGGPGGAGGVLTGIAVGSVGCYPITVGTGGTGGVYTSSLSYPTNGSNSTAFSQTAIGGGHGATNNSVAAANGGSGGGSANYSSGGGGTPGQGNDGGYGIGGGSAGGGGGAGASGNPYVSSTQGGDGGTGISDSITGIATYYGGGGGGGSQGTGGAGGNGGGGAGGSGTGNASNGVANTGGGGGSAGLSASGANGGNGGSGIVIISFAPTIVNYTQSGGTVTTDGLGNTVIIYTSSGQFCITQTNTPPVSIPWILGGNHNTLVSGVSQPIGTLDPSVDFPVVTTDSSGVTHELMRFKGSTGFIGMGTQTPGYMLELDCGSSSYAIGIMGSALVSGGIHSFSDKRFKNNIKKLESTTDKIKKLSGYTYNFNTEEFKNKNFEKTEQIGLIAQELKEVYPQLVKEDKDGYLAVNYQGMIPVLLEAIKDQQKQNDEQQKQIDELKLIVQAQAGLNNTNTGNRQSVELSNNSSVVLNQNIPNPFAEQSVITYNIPPSAGLAQILFYNQGGQLLKTINITTKGQGALTVFANDLTNGIYTYTLVVDGQIIDTKKMIKTQ